MSQRPTSSARLQALILALPLGAALLLRLQEIKLARLWLDEYIMLDIGSLSTAAEVARRAVMENNPPLYHVLVHGVLAWGTGPGSVLVLRILSALAGLLTVAAAADAARRRWGAWPAVLVAVWTGLSSICVHYSAEIRPYALLSLLYLVFLLVLDRALSEPARTPPPVAEVAVLVAAIWLHYYAFALLAVGPVTTLVRRDWRRSFLRQIGVSLTAALVAATVVVGPMLRLPPESHEYIADMWRGQDALAQVWNFFRELLPTAIWSPGVVHPTGFAGVLEIASIGVLALALLQGLSSSRAGDSDAGSSLGVAAAVLVGVSGSLILASAVLGRPIAIPGRGACALIAPFALATAGWIGTRPPGRACAAALMLLSVASLAFRVTHPPVRGVRPEVLAVDALRRNATRPALVITVGLSGLALRYHLRDRNEIRFRGFPRDVDQHYWWAPGQLSKRPDYLAAEARDAAAAAVAASRAGDQVFVESADSPVAASLRQELSQAFQFRPISRYNRGLLELVPRG